MKEATIHKKYDYFFDTEHLKEQLKDKAVRGGFSMITAQVVSFVLRTGSMMILARLLMPEHFGLIGMVTALTNIAERFKDLGLSTATVQRKEITHNQVSALFWVNVGFGTLLMLIVAALASVVSWFYGDHRLVGITLAISSSFFFGGLTVQHQALLQRQMRFRDLAWIQILTDCLSIAVGIGLAWRGLDYWSLVWMQVARSAFIAAGTWFVCRWRPSRPGKTEGLGQMLRFGRDISGSNIVTFLTQNLDQVLLGKFWGAGPLGFYRQASQMVSTPLSNVLNPVYAVATPTLSALQNDPEKYSRYCKKLVAGLSFLVMPVLIYLAIFSDVLVRVLLGERWMESAPIFRILAMAAMGFPAGGTCYLVMITCGKTVRMFWYGLIGAVLLTVAYTIGISWGPVGIAAAYTITAYTWLLPSLWYSLRGTPVSIRGISKAMFRPAFSSGVMGLLLVLALPELRKLGGLEIPFSLALGILSYCGVWMLLPGGFERLKEYFSYPHLVLRLRAAPK